MRVKLLTFRYSATLGGFDDTALVDFTRDKEVISFREHFYLVNEVPHLSCVVHYQDAVVPQAALEYARQAAPTASSSPAAPPAFRRRDGRPDPCAGLDEAGRALFNHFREWRSKQAHDDGVPPYLVLTDRQVLEILRRRPDSPTALGRIDRFVIEELGTPGYVRYMDDFALFAHDEQRLRADLARIEELVRDELGLALKESATILAPVSQGMPFLGWRIYRGVTRLRPDNARRTRRRLRHRRWELRTGRIAAERYAAAVQSVLAHLDHGDTLGWRRGALAAAFAAEPDWEAGPEAPPTA